MPNIYVINDGGTTTQMERVRCKDETRELQDILAHNNALLAGDQIDPDDPCRWLLIKREMPVPDPSTGLNRWSIDFLFVDQNAMPTFVECKRFDDTRSRREVIGQVLEYAANGPYYWSKAELLEHAGISSRESGSTLEDAFRKLQCQADSVDRFFDQVLENLKEGQLRIIFFLEESPNELKSLVGFLNKQMVSSEVLLIEARQYKLNGTKIVVPSVFGFTEQARQLKQNKTVEPREARQWDWPRFEGDARKRGLNDSDIEAMKKLHDACESLSADISWGRGKDTGSFSPKWSAICSGSILSVFSSGQLTLNFPSIQKAGIAESFRDRLAQMIVEQLGLQIPSDYRLRWTNYPATAWISKVDALIEILREILPATGVSV